MRLVIFIITVVFSLGCSKQDGISKQSFDSVKNSDKKEIIAQTKQTSTQPVKTHKKGESIELYDLIYSLLPEQSDKKINVEWSALDNIGFIVFDKQLYLNKSKDGKLTDKLILKSKKSKDKYNSSECYITLNGNQTGYSNIYIGVGCAKCFHDNEDYDYTINTVFNGFDHKLNEISINSYTTGYELILPGKQECYIIIKIGRAHV